jgi:hypothetical protein
MCAQSTIRHRGLDVLIVGGVVGLLGSFLIHLCTYFAPSSGVVRSLSTILSIVAVVLFTLGIYSLRRRRATTRETEFPSPSPGSVPRWLFFVFLGLLLYVPINFVVANVLLYRGGYPVRNEGSLEVKTSRGDVQSVSQARFDRQIARTDRMKTGHAALFFAVSLIVLYAARGRHERAAGTMQEPVDVGGARLM